MNDDVRRIGSLLSTTRFRLDRQITDNSSNKTSLITGCHKRTYLSWTSCIELWRMGPNTVVPCIADSANWYKSISGWTFLSGNWYFHAPSINYQTFLSGNWYIFVSINWLVFPVIDTPAINTSGNRYRVFVVSISRHLFYEVQPVLSTFWHLICKLISGTLRYTSNLPQTIFTNDLSWT